MRRRIARATLWSGPTALLSALLLAACASDAARPYGQYGTPVRSRAITHGSELMQFNARLAPGPDGGAVLQVEVLHPDHQPDRIAAFLLSNGVRLPAGEPDCDCICGFDDRAGNLGGVGCEHIDAYEAPVHRQWLERATRDGLAMDIEHVDGTRHDGPFIPGHDIEQFLETSGP